MIRLVVLGDPIDHSRSPAIHTAALSAAGIEGTYLARCVDEAGLRAAMSELRRGDLTGANITMPHKVAAAGLVDRRTEVSQRSGSVNTWLQRNGEIVGTSTDGEGILYALSEASVGDGLPPLILGAGGAAAAALLALESRSPVISARRPDAALELARRVGVPAPVIEWGRPLAGALVVNATPIGMGGESLPHAVIGSAAALLDMVYGPTATPAVLQAQEAGISVADGLTMLVGQAAASFRLWTGVEPNHAVMRAAALKPLKQVSDTAENAE